ncbi:MAG: type II secretion system F family protein [Candidatus Marinimicrobia bacterium]|nr:type II secretion system F family protein [Candidatus Neomarinimicrobiota bacterium]
MADFRYRATTSDGRRVQGFLNANNAGEAKKALTVLASRRNLKIDQLEKQSIFMYRAKGKYGEKVKGEQRAFSRTELQQALSSLDYSDIKIEKKLFGNIGGVSKDEIAQFLSLCSDLLKENLPFEEILGLIASDTQNMVLKSTVREIMKDLKDGKDGQEVFGKHQNIFGKFPAYMMGIATTSGNMQAIFESTAKFISRTQEFNKKVKNAIFMPAFTLGVVIVGLLYYMISIIPGTSVIFRQMGKPIPPLTQFTLDTVEFLTAYWVYLTIGFAIPVIAGLIFGRTEKGKIFFAKMKFKYPVIGRLIHNNAIEVFARVFQSLYSGAGANITVIRIASEASSNYYMERQIKDIAIPMMLKEGRGLVESFVATNVFTPTAISRFKSGEESGSLQMNARQLADYYEADNTYAMERLLNAINVGTALIITVAMLFLTLVSSETVIF